MYTAGPQMRCSDGYRPLFWQPLFRQPLFQQNASQKGTTKRDCQRQFKSCAAALPWLLFLSGF